MRNKTLFVVAVVLAVVFADAQLLSTETITRIVNGNMRKVHKANMRCNHDNVGVNQKFSVKEGPDGSPWDVEFICAAPHYAYGMVQDHYIPRAVQPVTLTVCMTERMSNLTLEAEQAKQDYVAARRRLLSASDMALSYHRGLKQAAAVTTVVASGGASTFMAAGGFAMGAVALGFALHNSGRINAIEHVLGDFKKQLDFTRKWIDKTDKWIGVTNNRLDGLDFAVDDIEHQATTNTEMIVDQQHTISHIEDVIVDVTTALISNFSTLQDEFVEGVNFTQEVADKMILLHNEVETQLTTIVNALQAIGRIVTNQAVTQEQIYTSLYLRREIIASYFRHYDTTVPGMEGYYKPAVPTYAKGSRPMSFSDRTLMRNIDNATVISEVYVAYFWVGGVQHVDTIRYMCDTDYLLNNTVPNMNFRTLFYMMGPDNGTTSCASTTPWTCHCVVTIERHECTKSGSAFPWEPAGALYGRFPEDPVDLYEICGVHSNPSVTAARKVITTTTAWATEIASLCSIWKGAVAYGGNKIRISSKYYRDKIDLTMLNPATGPAQCASIQFALLEQESGPDHAIYSIYQMFKNNYELVSATTVPQAEKLMYGSIPSGLDIVQHPFDYEDHTNSAAQCADVYFNRFYSDDVNLDHNKLPVYEWTPVDIVHQARVLVKPGTQATIDKAISSTGQMIIPVQGSAAGDGTFNVSLYSALSLQADYSFELPRQFVSFGHFPGDSRSDPLLQPAGDTANWKLIDNPQRLSPVLNMARSRSNTLTYAMQQASWAAVDPFTPITIDQFRDYYHERYEARSGRESAYNYLRGFDPTTGKCDERFYQGNTPSGGAARVAGTGYSDLCLLMDKFLLTPDYANMLMKLQPRQFSYDVSVEVPGDIFTQILVSKCPRYEVTLGQSSATIRFFNDLDTANTFIYKVTPLDPAICSAISNQEMSIAAKTYKDITIPACGTEYYANVKISDGSNTWCFAEPGIDLKVAHAGGDSSSGISTIETHVDTYVGQVSKRLTQDISATSDMMLNINNVAYEAKDDAEVEASIKNIIAARLKHLENIRDNLHASNAHLRESYDGMITATKAQENRMITSVKRQHAIHKNVTALLAKEADLRKNATALATDIHGITKQVDDANDRLDRDWDNYLRDKCDLGIPFVSSVMCALGARVWLRIFSFLPDFLAKIFAVLGTFLVWAAVIGGGYYLATFLYALYIRRKAVTDAAKLAAVKAATNPAVVGRKMVFRPSDSSVRGTYHRVKVLTEQ